jgi:hypothetical protein
MRHMPGGLLGNSVSGGSRRMTFPYVPHVSTNTPRRGRPWRLGREASVRTGQVIGVM